MHFEKKKIIRVYYNIENSCFLLSITYSMLPFVCCKMHFSALGSVATCNNSLLQLSAAPSVNSTGKMLLLWTENKETTLVRE